MMYNLERTSSAYKSTVELANARGRERGREGGCVCGGGVHLIF